MKMSTDISKKCTECGKSVWPSLATAIIVLIKKGDQVLLVHARNFKGNFDSLVAGLWKPVKVWRKLFIVR